MNLLSGRAVFMAFLNVLLMTACNNNGEKTGTIENNTVMLSDSRILTDESDQPSKLEARLNFRIVLADGASAGEKYKVKFLNADTVVSVSHVLSVEENGKTVIKWTVSVPAGISLKKPALNLDEGHSRSSRFVFPDMVSLKAQDYDLQRDWALVKPQVTGIDSNSNNEFFTSEKANVTISGASVGYRFYFDGGGKVTLRNVNATLYAVGCLSNYIWSSSSKDLYVTIEGTNSIRNPYSCYAIYSNRNLRLNGNGTLTVTVRNPNDRGLFASNYNSSGISADTLADAGSTVRCSSKTDNGDGTYSWTYTVSSK